MALAPVFAACAHAGTEFPVSTALYSQYDPAVSGNIVVWTDDRDWASGDVADIYGYDISAEQEFPVCTAGGTQSRSAISGAIVTWTDSRNQGTTGHDIYGYDLSTDQEFAICTAAEQQESPAISGDIVVWCDGRNWQTTGNDIYGYNLSTSQEFPVCTAAGDQDSPALWGDIVVWRDARNWQTTANDIYGYDLSTSQEFPVCTAAEDQDTPAVWGGIAVWRDGRNWDTTGYDIYGYKLSTDQEFTVCTATEGQAWPAICGPIVVWQDGRTQGTGWDIYGYRLDIPSLSSGYLFPASGDTGTRFTWRIKYWHTGNAPPTGVWLGIWSSATKTTSWQPMWALDPGDTFYLDGKWYTYSGYLQAGDHSCRFAAQIGGEWVYWPQPAGAYQLGPTVEAGPPLTLSSGYVMPSSGTGSTVFTWRIKYWNSDDTAPDEMWCAIWWGSRGKAFWHPMWALDPGDTNYRDGTWYTVHMRWLDSSAHAYRFAARQGSNWACWPRPAGSYGSGPTVGP